MRENILKLARTSGSRIYVVILGFISLTITARILGPEGRGQVASVTTWITTLATLSHFSLGPVVLRQASLDVTKDWFPHSYALLVINSLLATLITLIILTVIYLIKPAYFGGIPIELLLIGFGMLPFMIWDNYGSHLLMASNEVDYYNRTQVIGRTIGFIFLLTLLLFFNLGPEGVIFSNLIGFFIATFAMFFLFIKKSSFKLPPLKAFLTFYKGGSILHLNALGTFLFSGADVLILNYLKGSSETGLYQLGIQLIGVMLVIPQSASMILYSQITSKGAIGGWKEHRRFALLVTIGMALVSLVIGASVELWLPIIVGNKFQESIDIFKYQILVVPLITFCTVMGPQWITRGLFWQASTVAIILAISNIVLNRFLIPEYGAYGAVWSSIISYLIAVTINVGLYKYCDMKLKAISS